MKKLLATITALALVVAMGTTTAFAAEANTSPKDVTTDGGTASIDVNAKYSGGVTTKDTISVNVAWGEMEFTYSAGGTKVWNAENHTYSVQGETAGWSATGNTVTVTNHSNVAIKAELSFTAETAFSGITGKFDNATLLLNAGEENKPDDADKKSATLTLDGTLASDKTALTKVGTVTVKIAKQ